MTRRPLRRAGAAWRLLVHRHETDGPRSSMAYHVQSDRIAGDTADTEFSRTTVLERTEFDELVVGKGIAHIEQMNTGVWWMQIAGITVHVIADRDGRPTAVRVDGPGDYADPVDGCEYELNWSAE
jgi:hypothetical protein